MKTYKKVVIAISSVIFITLLLMYLFSDLSSFDEFFYKRIIFFKSDFFTNVFKCITFLGSGVFLIGLVIVSILSNKKIGISILISVLFVNILNNLIKIIVCRHRPLDINLIVETGYSFPSGHSINSISAYGLIFYYLYISKFEKNLKKVLLILIFLIMILVPISRVYLGVHYFSDVVAGSCLGIIWIMLYTTYLEKKIH